MITGETSRQSDLVFQRVPKKISMWQSDTMTFSAVMGMFNLLVRPYSCYVLYSDWLDRNELQPKMPPE